MHSTYMKKGIENGKDGNDAHGIKRQAVQRIVSDVMLCTLFTVYSALDSQTL